MFKIFAIFISIAIVMFVLMPICIVAPTCSTDPDCFVVELWCRPPSVVLHVFCVIFLTDVVCAVREAFTLRVTIVMPILQLLRIV
jgi:hypothetical protein